MQIKIIRYIPEYLCISFQNLTKSWETCGLSSCKSIAHSGIHASAYSALRSAHFESRCFTQRLDIGLEIGNNTKTKRWLNKDTYPTVDTVVLSETRSEVSDREHGKVNTINSQWQYCVFYILSSTFMLIKSMLISRYVWCIVLSRWLLFNRFWKILWSQTFIRLQHP